MYIFLQRGTVLTFLLKSLKKITKKWRKFISDPIPSPLNDRKSDVRKQENEKYLIKKAKKKYQYQLLKNRQQLYGF